MAHEVELAALAAAYTLAALSAKVGGALPPPVCVGLKGCCPLSCKSSLVRGRLSLALFLVVVSVYLHRWVVYEHLFLRLQAVGVYLQALYCCWGVGYMNTVISSGLDGVL